MEVVRKEKLERLFFVWPQAYHKVGQRNQIEDTISTKLNHVQRDDSEVKLKVLVQIAKEVMQEVQLAEDISAGLTIRLRTFIQRFIPGPNALDTNNDVLMLSICITAITLVSFDHTCPGIDVGSYTDGSMAFEPEFQVDRSCSHRPHSLQTYGRASSPRIAYMLFLVVAVLHVILCITSFHEFLEVRVRVLREMKAWNSKHHYLRMDEHRKHVQRADFMARTVHVFGMSEDITTRQTVTAIMSRYGAVTTVQVVRQGNLSWAMVVFSGADGARRLMSQLVDVEGADVPGLEFTHLSKTRYLLVSQCNDE